MNIKLETNWVKKVHLIAEYHRAQQAKHPKKRNTGIWKLADTAKELGFSTGYISESIRISDYIDKHPGDWIKLDRGTVLEMIRKDG